MIGSKKNVNSMTERPSLYCVWIKSNDAPDAPLVSLWIDPRMRAFAGLGDEQDARTTLSTEDTQEIVEDPDLTSVYHNALLQLTPKTLEA